MPVETHIAAEAWRGVLERTRQFNRNRDNRLDLRPYWRVKAWRAAAGQEEPLVRAAAFAGVLEQAPLYVYEGERIAGSMASFLIEALPGNVTAEDRQTAAAEHNARGQRNFTAGFDHTLADYPTLLNEGLAGLSARVEASLARHTDRREQTCLLAMRRCVLAFSAFISRYAVACRQAGCEDLAQIIEAVAWQPPKTFHQAMQLVWLTHTAMASEGRAHNALGRLDQYLLSFYRRDLAAGRIDEAGALDLLCHLWAKIEEHGHVTNICIGGLTPEGADATNELSYLCLRATALVLTPHANLSARFHDFSSDEFHRACFECIRTGVGFPAIFNDHVLIPGLVSIGIPEAVARDTCMVGCIETMLAGRQPAWSDSRFNTPLYLLSAMRRMAGEKTRSYERLLELFVEDASAAVAEHARNINAKIAAFPVERFPDPFLSVLTRDCVARARDVNDGGAEFPRMHGVAVMGLASLADSLMAVRKLVFEDAEIGYDDLMVALESDFAGQEPLRQRLLNCAPKYGNDESDVDAIAAWIVDLLAEECLKHRLACGGWFVSAMAANVSNIPAGKEVGATPDGRHAGAPLSDAASPYFGRDRNGPTAFLHSVSRPDYRRVLTGSVINMKFEPSFFHGPDGADRFAALTHFFVSRRIPELQFNFTGNRVLLDAQARPEEYPNLVVRVSGFSAYFTRLNRDVQEDIIRRRSHGGSR